MKKNTVKSVVRDYKNGAKIVVVNKDIDVVNVRVV